MKFVSSMFSRSRPKREKGVVLIYFILILGVMLGFLMLVLNTGMLVYQKIRLQTAADLAAYAGASVQASYLGNETSGDQSIASINNKILERYGKLLNKLRFGTVAAWPQGFPDPFSCAAACTVASLANAQKTVNEYKAAASDIEQYRTQIVRILSQMPKAARQAAEATIGANIQDLMIDQNGFAALQEDTTNDVAKVVKAATSTSSSLSQPKNAVLSFESEKGLYLANVVAPVPHAFAFFGPACFNLYAGQVHHPYWFCSVNGAGYHGPTGYQAAALAFGKVFSPKMNGNIGQVGKIFGNSMKTKAIRLQYILNPNRPDPSFTVAAEWYPKNGSFANLENSLGAAGSLFPKQTRLVAVASAEPFGGSLVNANLNVFGTRLQSIRKILLDPRLRANQEDFPNLYKYFETLGALDQSGRPTESGEEVIRKFLH